MTHAEQSSRLRIGLAQLNYKVGDLEANFAKIAATIERARAQGVELVVFSEMALIGYPAMDMVHRKSMLDAQLANLERVAKLTDASLGVVVGYVDYNHDARGKHLYNAAALCHDGKVVARIHKSLLPTYDVFDEERYFERAQRVGTHLFKGVRLGISICEDAWNSPNGWEMPRYANDPISALVKDGAELLINISASPFGIDKNLFRRELLAGHAQKHARSFVFVNQVGGNDELIFDGRSFVLSPQGELVCQLGDFVEDFAVIDLPILAGAPVSLDPALLHPTTTAEAEQAYRALVLGLRDYVHKSGFKGALIGLSGGVDSALVAAIAVEALGPDNVLTVGMPSRYSSDHSVADAQTLAKNLGVRFELSSIEPQFQAFLTQLDPLFAGLAADVTEENLQARVRGMFLMALSNKLGHLVLATGNKSELATGYTTLYGDMNGALMVIGDTPKMLVYRICRHVNALAGYEVIPENILQKPPSAELRPDQTDQDTLPPYEILDAIIDAYMRLGLEADAICAQGFERPVVERTIAMIHRAEYKRWQGAPVLKISTKAFGFGWRYPLAANYRWTP
ncbi:MAG: NAD+ synthase [Bradymonadaceae bacterium]|nr:NAD+ synthase [Lujinxingiaceae bacterium]